MSAIVKLYISFKVNKKNKANHTRQTNIDKYRRAANMTLNIIILKSEQIFSVNTLLNSGNKGNLKLYVKA